MRTGTETDPLGDRRLFSTRERGERGRISYADDLGHYCTCNPRRGRVTARPETQTNGGSVLYYCPDCGAVGWSGL